MTDESLTVAKLRADLEHAVRWNYVGGAFGTAQLAVSALERLVAAEPSDVFTLLDDLSGKQASRD